MLKKLLLGVSLTVLLIGFVSANIEDNTSLPPYQKSEFIIPDTYKDLVFNYPNQWKRLSGYNYSALHWEQFVVVYTNNKGSVYANNHYEFMRVYEDDLDPEEDEINYKKYPIGTILLKESFLNKNSRPANPLLLSGMIKRQAGYDPQFGDWEYFQSDNQGQLLFSGNSKNTQVQVACISCHSNIQDQDYVFASHYSMSTQ
jgi:hypothetical protein